MLAYIAGSQPLFICCHGSIAHCCGSSVAVTYTSCSPPSIVHAVNMLLWFRSQKGGVPVGPSSQASTAHTVTQLSVDALRLAGCLPM